MNRLIGSEALPLLAHLLLWASVGIALGPAPLALLVAVNLCVNAAYGLCAVNTRKALLRLRRQSRRLRRAAARRAWMFELLSMLAALLAAGLIEVTYFALDRPELACLIGLQSLGIPARCNGPLKARVRPLYLARSIRAWAGAAAVLAALHVEPSVEAVAMALAGREWLAAVLLALVPKIPLGTIGTAPAGNDAVSYDLPSWKELAANTAEQAGRRFIYQISRSTLHLVLGPLGTVFARAARGLRILPRGRTKGAWRGLSAISAPIAIIAAVLLAQLVPGPGSLVGSALLLRIACLAVAALFWERFRLYPKSLNTDEDD